MLGFQREQGGHYSASSMPRWVAFVFFAGCLGIIPQIITLNSTLAQTAMAHHWRMTWVGLDVAEALAFLVTAVLLFCRSALVVITASVAAAMLWLDAWFDVLTSPAGKKLVIAARLALSVELPLGLFCLLVAVKALGLLRQNQRRDTDCDGGDPPLRE